MNLDGHAWMKALRMPYFTIAALRTMKVGDELCMLDVLGPPMLPIEARSSVRVTFARERGHWHYEALWMLHVGHVRRRGHIYTFGDFKLRRGSTIELLPGRGDNDPLGRRSAAHGERLLRRVCRLSARLARMAQARGDNASWIALSFYPRKSRDDDLPAIVPFLDTIAATWPPSLIAPPPGGNHHDRA